MPPLRAGLVKRKIDDSDGRRKHEQSSSDEESDTELVGASGDGALPADLRLQLDAGDPDSDTESDVEQKSDQSDDDDNLSSHERVLDDSSELTDSDDSDLEEADGDDTDEDDGTSEQELSEQNDSTDTESGIGHTNSSGSDVDNNSHIKQKKPSNKNKTSSKSKSSIDKLADSIKKSSFAIQPVAQKDEYESGDTSDEEERQNTVGDIPMWWYNEYPHMGYDLDGNKIMKPPQRDHIDDFLKKCEDPDFWRTVRDPATGQDVVLSKEDLELIHRLRTGQLPNPDHDEYKPWIEWFTSETLATPVRAFPEHKRSFLPSRHEQRQIGRIVHALKMGWVKTRKQLALERRARKEKQFYNLWGSVGAEDEAALRGVHKHVPAPRRPLPAHAESYNPPPEYLLDDKEMKEWERLSETPWKRKYTFLPTKHASLREVPAYPRFIRERFLRCLDLYLAPRAIKMRLTISADDLVPKLPSPRELQPFPTSEALLFRGHAGLVRAACFDPSGQYAASAGDDGTVRVWEAATARCLRTVQLGEPAACVQWTPAAGLSLLAVAVGRRLLLINPGADIGAHRVALRTDRLLEEPPPQGDVVMDERTAAAVQWEDVSAEQWARGVRLSVLHCQPVQTLAWHARGDYLCCTLRDAQSRSVVVHQLSRRRSQLPFSRALGLVQCALFHPSKPLLFVGTQRAVRVYDLVKQEMVRKLAPGVQWLSCLALHPGGDNLVAASYDRRLAWFDLELSARPYRTLRLHGSAVRAAAFHPRYPLLASAGDDPYIVVTHAMVYNDLLQNPLLVPVKQLAAGARRSDLRTLALAWHPAQPWLLAAGADGLLRLYS